MTKRTEDKRSNLDKLVDWITYRHKHNFELISTSQTYDTESYAHDMPAYRERIYLCKSCGAHKKIKC
jgi:hypothetical protein